MFTGFVAVFYLSNCQRWDFIFVNIHFRLFSCFTEDLHFEKCAVLAKTSETGSTETSVLIPSCIHIPFFSRLISVSNYCKNHFMPAQKMSLHIFQVNALSKFYYFVVCDAYPETLMCLLKCNCQQLYFHVGMGT